MDPKLEEVTRRDVGNAMRDSHFFLTRVSGVDTLTRAETPHYGRSGTW